MQLTRALWFAWTLSLSSDAFDLSNLGHLRNSLLNRDANAEALLNNTITFGDTRAAYDAKVMIVDLNRCYYTLTDKEFYHGFIVSSYGYISGNCADYTSFRAGKDKETTSSAWGPPPKKKNTPYHQWIWLQFPDRYDIRYFFIRDMEFRAWNAMPQMYFPLMSPTDAQLGGSLAYMLWVKPSRKLLGDSSAYHEMGGCGFNRPEASALCSFNISPQRRMLWNIDLVTLIRSIGSDLSVDPFKGYTYQGVEYETNGKTQTMSNSYTDVNYIFVQTTSQGIAGEPLCGYAVAATENQKTFMDKLGHILKWITA